VEEILGFKSLDAPTCPARLAAIPETIHDVLAEVFIA
jgi:hypothetical protein